MGRIFFCEGKTDVALIRTFLERSDRKFQLKEFIGEEVEHTRLQNRETRAIKNFIEPYNPYDVLAKSENGKPDLIQMFVTVINFLSGHESDVYLVIDLDTENIHELTRRIDEKIQGRYEGRRLEVTGPNLLDRNSDVITCEHKLAQNDNPIGGFCVIAFEPTLEAVAGITDDDEPAVRDRKLNALLDRRHVHNALHGTVL